jgi:hypothetical protein
VLYNARTQYEFDVRVFTTKWFARFARKEGISAEKLIAAVREAEEGLNDGELGGGLIKKRVARAGSGKRGGYRTIIVYRVKKRAVFVYGFAKNVTDNINDAELFEYRKLARIYLDFNDADIERALKIGELKEVN